MPNTHRAAGNLSDCKELHETSHDGKKSKGNLIPGGDRKF